MLVGELTEKIWVVQPGAGAPNATPFLQLDASQLFGEQGLMDVLPDPSFAQNGWYYVFYTHGSAGQNNRNRVSRFTASGNATVAGSEVVLWEDDVNAAAEHHGGTLGFGPDGKLYISSGDQFDAPSAQQLTNFHGKILRINKDGTVPTDNPFFDGNGANKDAIWAYGLRNPFRTSFDPATGRLYIGDVGGNDPNTAIEEVNLGAAGANYGWPLCEGSCGVAGTTGPIHSYPHSDATPRSPAASCIAARSSRSEYRGQLLLRGLRPEHDQAPHLRRERQRRRAGELLAGGRRSRHRGGGRPGQTDPGSGRLALLRRHRLQRPARAEPGGDPQDPLHRRATSRRWSRRTRRRARAPRRSRSRSRAPGRRIPRASRSAYTWTFGDGATSTQANPTHVYTNSGQYVARLSVSDGASAALSPDLAIAVGNPPSAVISAPTNGGLFRAGDVIAFSGTATDPEDGTLPPSAFSWTILFHHDSHVHPAGGPFTNTRNGTLAIPFSGHDFQGATSYEIVLTVTDSTGLSNATSVTIFPDKVNLSFGSVPSGLELEIDGIRRQTPFVLDDVKGFQHTIGAPDQVAGGSAYRFGSWSDGGAQSHPIAVPNTNQSYVATFQPGPAGLVAGYGFEEASGNAVSDGSGAGNHGTLSGATRTTAGRIGRALVFNGTNALVSIPDANSLDLTGAMTLEAWVFPTTTGGWRDVIYKGQNDLYFLEGSSWAGNAPAMGGTFSPIPLYSGSGALPLNTWSHLAATYDGATLRLFVNGAQVASRAQTGPIQISTGPLSIGGDALYGQYFAGSIDEVRVYNRALGAAEIQADMSRAVP